MKRVKKALVFVVIIFMIIIYLCARAQGVQNKKEKLPILNIEEGRKIEENVPSYEEVSSTYKEKKNNGETIILDLNQSSDQDGNLEMVTDYKGYKGLLWNQDQSASYCIPFKSMQGLYSIEFSYIPLKELDTDIVLEVKIDGKTPFREASAIELSRRWVPESDNYFDEKGNEYASYLVQEERLSKCMLQDRTTMHSGNFLFWLEEGNHNFEMKYISGSMLITGIKLIPFTDCISYEEYRRNHEGKDYDGKALVIQGEAAAERSSRDIPNYAQNDASMTPYKAGKSVINAFGGGYWYKPNSSGTWKFTVPKDGYYKLSLRLLQNNNGLISHRQILIDGKVPFREIDEYEFEHNDKYHTEVIGGEEPYLFYLTKGEHTLSMRAVVGEMADSIQHLQEVSDAIGLMTHDIQMITGTSPDPNFDYEIDKKMPYLIEEIKIYENNIKAITNRIVELCGTSPALASTLYSDAELLRTYSENPRIIPSNINMITSIQGDINDAVSSLQSQPLGIDWFSFQAPAEDLYEPKASMTDGIKLAIYEFVNSFKKEEKGTKNAENNTIDLWVARDREWGNMLQRMISEDFEPKYGVKVNVNVLPAGNTTVVNGASPLLLSVVSGDTPDIALGCDSKTPVELAIRGQLADLSEFSDFEEVSKRFPKSTIKALSYEGKCYGVPETMDMPILVYRTDIMEQNQIEVPNTWEELWRYTLPQLTQVDGNFYMGTSSMNMFASFLYQNGGSFYDAEGECALNSDAAITAFDQWTKCFVQYNVPQAASFYNEMRTGTLPMGICSLAEYMQLQTYASELTGKLRIAPIPGVMQSDGTISRDGVGDISSAVIFENSKKKDSSWLFLKWWTSKEVQERFATGVETRVGATGRWFSANEEAFKRLPVE